MDHSNNSESLIESNNEEQATIIHDALNDTADQNILDCGDIIDEAKMNTAKGREIELYKACSTHKHCLMCKSKMGLHKIKSESILFAYRHYGTIIKEDSYCCNRHFESNGEI